MSEQKVKPKPQMAKIVKVVKETRDTSTLRLELPKPFEWRPGQFIMVIANINGENVRRAYSVASSPTKPYLEISIRQTETPTMSKYLNEVVEGDEIQIKGPYGKFIWDETVSPQIFCLAAGSGITPFRAYAQYIIDNNLKNPYKLLYSCPYGDDVIYYEELPKLIGQIPNHEYKLFITREPRGLTNIEHGRINLDVLKKEIKGYENANFHLCGSPGFVTALIDDLVEIGIPREQIKREQWG